MNRALTESREGNDLENAVPRRCLNAPGRWDFMISYTRRNPKAELLATELYHSLRERGYTVWLDVKMKHMNESVMSEAAQNSRCILAVVSGAERAGDPEANAYFKRPYCCNELRWALEAGVPIQPVIHPNDKERIGELVALAPPDLQFLGAAADFIHIDRSRPAYWRTSVDEVIEGANNLIAAATGRAGNEAQGVPARRVLQPLVEQNHTVAEHNVQ